MSPDDDLERWIVQLRDRLTRGDLAHLPPVDVGYGTRHIPAERTVRIMLADLADLDDPEGSVAGDPLWRDERRRSLMLDFQRLRLQLGGLAGLRRPRH